MLRRTRFASSTSFYPNDPLELTRFFEANTLSHVKKKNAFSVICPHAGYVFSGKTALKALELVSIPDSVILIGPNHTGQGASLSIMSSGEWEIPGAILSIDVDLATNIIRHTTLLSQDTLAHNLEHSLEVLLPMLHFFNKNISFVPIVMKNYAEKYWKELALGLFQTSLEIKKSFLVVASTDMSHYVSREQAKHKDSLVFEKIRNLDSFGLMERVEFEKISMCGSAPVATSILYSKLKGATMARLIDYTDSGTITGSLDRVVSYASFVIE